MKKILYLSIIGIFINSVDLFALSVTYHYCKENKLEVESCCAEVEKNCSNIGIFTSGFHNECIQNAKSNPGVNSSGATYCATQCSVHCLTPGGNVKTISKKMSLPAKSANSIKIVQRNNY